MLTESKVSFRAIESDGFKSLKEEQSVTYVEQAGQRGSQATQVRAE